MPGGCGLVPRAKTIEDMGDKERARDIACACAIPVLPGSARFTPGDSDGVMEAAKEVGFPLLVKAAAGGGGIGMRRVDGLDTLAKEVANAQALAARAFADDTVYLERYAARARHVEVQVFGFGDGTGVHLFERDCSVQRRYQKVIEEAPAPGLPKDVRLAMREAAMALVHQQRYRGAGTVEFIYEPDAQEFFFLEMNTRIQVEHAVTEMITGIDLIRWQIELAAGSLAPVPQDAVVARGAGVECRIYAERPDKRFLPSPGELSRFQVPEGEAHVRVDSGVREGDRITPYYDPLLAKSLPGAGIAQPLSSACAPPSTRSSSRVCLPTWIFSGRCCATRFSATTCQRRPTWRTVLTKSSHDQTPARARTIFSVPRA